MSEQTKETHNEERTGLIRFILNPHEISTFVHRLFTR
jgi:hypothetical protein